jgi:predicted secreted protein with PEFG-CTERM motif
MLNQFITLIITIVALTLGAPFTPFALADDSNESKLAFAGHLEETLGHFWAIEKNLDEKNAELALVHATHPIAELYDLMKPELQKNNPELDNHVKQILLDLGKKTGKDVTRQDAQKAIDDAKKIVEIARTAIIGNELSQDTNFKIKLMQGLLETSIGEYGEGVANGQINLMAEFQDGSAFVWRSQQIYDTIKSDIPQDSAKELDEFYVDLWNGYKERVSPVDIETRADAIIHELDEVAGTESKETNLLDYVDNVRALLKQAKEEYTKGNTDVAQSLVTKAYLDNFEFLESTIMKQNPELKTDMEQMMRVELRDMIKSKAPVSQVNEQINKILVKMDDVAVIVPEFGTIAVMVLVVAFISIISVTARSKLSLTSEI